MCTFNWAIWRSFVRCMYVCVCVCACVCLCVCVCEARINPVSFYHPLVH